MISALDSLARMAAERMVNSIVAGIVLTTLAWCLLHLLPRLNARSRVAVWLSVLMAIPGLSVAAMFIAGAPSTLANHTARIIIPENLAFAILLAWALLATVALLRVGFGLWRIRSLRETCKPIHLADLNDEIRATVERFRPKRAVALLESETARVPVAVGFFRPAVILPQWILAELSPQEISAILIHEFAHLRRWDDWTNFFQKLVAALFFFHPSIWWVDRRLALEREIACDDAVLAATNKAHDYARCLVGLAEKSLLRRSLAMAQAAVHRVQHISLRISQILDPRRPRASRVSRIALAGVTGLTAICFVAVLQSPTLIAFQDKVAATATQRTLSGAEGAVDGYKDGKTGSGSRRTAEAAVAAAGSVVPVVMRQQITGSPGSLTRARKANVAVAHRKSRDVVVPAKFAPQPEQAKVLRARLSIHQQTVIPVESVLFVMPDARFDASGRVVWTFSVWRFTVFHPVQAAVEQTVPNSI